MDKKQAIRDILTKIYSSDSSLVISETEIKNINEAYKNFNFKGSYNEFLYNNPVITGIIGTLQSGKYEIEKQYRIEKGLQSGILSECVYAQTLSRILGLEKCLDLDSTPLNSIPVHCRHFIQFLQSRSDYFSAARYVYYSSKDIEKFIVQYGNPDAGDAHIIYYDNEIHIEFKEPNAKVGENDLELDMYGKLIASEKLQMENPLIKPYLDEFNSKHNLFELLGTNYKLDSEDNLLMVQNYFESRKIDLLITSKNSELICVDTDNLLDDIDGEPIISTEGSEIRSTGRNHSKLLLKDNFRKLVVEKCEGKIEGNRCTIKKYDLPGYGEVVGRGGSKITRYKLNYIFFVPIGNVVFINDELTFDIDKVEQCKPTISIHLQIVRNKNELSKLYLKQIKKADS